MAKETELTKKFYTEDPIKEWERLDKDPYNHLEFETTMKFLNKHLHQNGHILDAGGGPGRYSIELAKQGYSMTLLDLVPANLELAQEKIKEFGVKERIREVMEGSITDLSRFTENSFDAVLCLGGPLSHVHPEKERKKAVSELVRVAKKDAPIFVSVMSKFGLLTNFFDWIDEIKDTDHLKSVYLKGDDYRWCGNGYSHFFELKELVSLFENMADIIGQVGLEGLSTPNPEKANELALNEPEAWKNLKEMHYELCTHPTVVDCSGHFMVIAKKR
ncbi:MAG: class I SAM-dependent methyltransferase [Patescibacteria group bacterium]